MLNLMIPFKVGLYLCLVSLHISVNLTPPHFTKASVHPKLGGRQPSESTDLPCRRRQWRFCTVSSSVVCDSLATHGLQLARLLCPWCRLYFPCEESTARELWKKLCLEGLWGPS